MEEGKLCGQLSKITFTGPLKNTRARWFSYDASTCDLVYYRASKNSGISNSLNTEAGRIPLRRASFNLTASNISDNIFTIHSEGETHTIQALNKNALKWWLQRLQEERRDFNLKEQPAYTEVKNDFYGNIQGSSVFWLPKDKQGLIHPKQSPGDSPGVTKLRSNALTDVPTGNLIDISEPQPPTPQFSPRHLLSVEKVATFFNRRKQNILNESSTSSADFNSQLASNFINQNQRCLEDTLQQYKEELNLMKSTLESKEETIQLLKLELEKAENDKNTASKFSSTSDYKMRSDFINLKLKHEKMEQDMEEKSLTNKALLENNTMLTEMLQIKDDVVVQLSNKLCDVETSLRALTKQHEELRSEKNEEFVLLTPTNSNEDLTKIMDKLQGYTDQNHFLNQEIVQLDYLRRLDNNKLQDLQDKVQLQEAEYCQLHSKYLIVLAGMNKPSKGSGFGEDTDAEDNKTMVKILIKDAMARNDLGSVTSKESQRDDKYDRHGFSCMPEDDSGCALLTAASYLEKKSSDIQNSLQKYDQSLAVKWQNYFAANKEIQRNDELKNLIRMGIPHELRTKVWSWLINLRTADIRKNLDPDYYEKLKNSKEAQLPSKQIELDLLRTLPNNKHFNSMSSIGIEQLRRVLRAYSIHNPSIGYCQGLNRIVAVALLYLSEEDAFWCLVCITECIMPTDYYSMTLTASQADQRVFRDLLADKLPKVHRHLENAGVDCSLITFNWLLCLFCDNVPPDTMFHIWDILLNESSKILFRFGIAFFKYVEDAILELTDYMAIFNFLRSMSHRMHDVRGLTDIALRVINPFPMRKINRLRAIHMEKVTAELLELDKLRHGFVRVGENSDNNKDIDSDED